MPPGTAEPEPSPEGKALRLARISRHPSPLSIREAARRSGAVSETHWRHVEAGYESKGGMKIPVRVSAKTLARMAIAVDMTPARLRQLGREDAAEVLDETLAAAALADVLPDIVRDNWDDEVVQAMWRQDRPLETRLGVITRYLADTSSPANRAQANGTEDAG